MGCTMPRYEFSEGKSNKFWEIKIEGKFVTTTYGKIGSSGQSTSKSFSDEPKAKAAYEKLVKEKTHKGYELKGEKAKASATAVKPVSKYTPVKSSNPDALYLVQDGSSKLWSGY